MVHVSYIRSRTPHSALSTTNTRTRQGHILAALGVGSNYYWGQGMAINYPRAMAAYKVGAEGGNAVCQFQVGFMYYYGRGEVDVDYTQALPWFKEAAAQDNSGAVAQLGTMYIKGQGVTPSWRRAREYYEKAFELGESGVVENIQILDRGIQAVTSERSHNPATSRTPPTSDMFSAPLPFSFSRPAAHSQAAPLMDKRVEIHGASRADINGKRGVATDFHTMDAKDRTTWRYTVKLDGGEAFKVKQASVRAEEGPGGGSGGGGGGGGAGTGKAKGKGKKGRSKGR